MESDMESDISATGAEHRPPQWTAYKPSHSCVAPARAIQCAANIGNWGRPGECESGLWANMWDNMWDDHSTEHV